MKNIYLLLVAISILFAACSSDNNSNTGLKKKGEEDPLVERYMKDLVPNATNQDQIDRNLIVNLLMDSLWDFQRTASGIYYQIEKPGTGEHPSLSSDMVCHYRGTLLNGEEFDSSYKRGRPLEFKLVQMIAAWQEVIPLLKKGGKATFIVPSKLAYGTRPRGAIIKPNSVLMFEVEVVDFS